MKKDYRDDSTFATLVKVAPEMQIMAPEMMEALHQVNTECPLCLMDMDLFDRQNPLFTTTCQHQYHLDCFVRSMRHIQNLQLPDADAARPVPKCPLCSVRDTKFQSDVRRAYARETQHVLIQSRIAHEEEQALRHPRPELTADLPPFDQIWEFVHTHYARWRSGGAHGSKTKKALQLLLLTPEPGRLKEYSWQALKGHYKRVMKCSTA